MSTQIAVRLRDEGVRFMDSQVEAGHAKSRAKYLDSLLIRAQREAEYRREKEILDSIEGPLYPDLEPMYEWIERQGPNFYENSDVLDDPKRAANA